MTRYDLTRRNFLTRVGQAAAGIALLGCPRVRQTPDASPATTPGVRCDATEDNIEGPYYRGGAPWRDDLSKGQQGQVLELGGKIVSVGASSCVALAGVTLDVWQADHEGHYDNDGHAGAAGAYVLRGRLTADRSGHYALRTIWPGRYLNGARYRPAHLHVKLSAPGHHELTTQLYFPDDPYNDGDPFIKESLVMAIRGAHDAHFDFALRPL